MARWHIRRHERAPSGGGGLAVLAVGLVAGLAAGAYLAHRLGGVAGITARVRRRLRAAPGSETLHSPTGSPESAMHGSGDPYDDDEEDFSRADLLDDEDQDDDLGESNDIDDEETFMPDEEREPFASADPELEDRVLNAFTNDPVLAERAIDIGAVNPGTIELTGAVYTDGEYEHATIVTRGVPGVETVVNRLAIRDDEASEAQAAKRYEAGDASSTEAGWNAEREGTGRPRQGDPEDVGRHTRDNVPNKNRARTEADAIRDAADDVPG